MFLCIDPGSKYIGYTLIENSKIIAKGLINYYPNDVVEKFRRLLEKNKKIHTVLIEKGENLLREYEIILLNLFKHEKVTVLTYQAKLVRKKLKLERHPSSLGVKAKKELIKKYFPALSLEETSIHEIDSALLYIYYLKKTC